MIDETAAQNAFMDRFVLEPKVQRVWDVPHATWFTLMGVGGGLFILARLLNLEGRLDTWLGIPVADVLSFACIAVGGLILIADLGKPLRFIRAVLNPGSSWISRGAIADFVFLAAGGLLVLPNLSIGGSTPFSWLPWDASATNAAGRALEAVGLVSAAVVTFYAGQVLAAPRAIPYWHSPWVPVQFVLSALASSVAALMALETANDRPVAAGQLWLLLAFLLLLVVAIGWHVRTNADRPGKRESVDRLLRGRHRGTFLLGVVAGGAVLPALAVVVGLAWVSARDGVAILSLVVTVLGGFGLRLITLRVGIFPPVRATPPTR
jgi:formate-dependent nitrite reductase membrane component NrfD